MHPVEYLLLDNRGRLALRKSGFPFVYSTLHTAQIAKRLLDERDENFYKIVEV